MFFTEGLCHQFFYVIKPLIVLYFFSCLSLVCQGKEELLPGLAYKMPGVFPALWAFGSNGYCSRGSGCGVSTLFPIVSLVQQGSRCPFYHCC